MDTHFLLIFLLWTCAVSSQDTNLQCCNVIHIPGTDFFERYDVYSGQFTVSSEGKSIVIRIYVPQRHVVLHVPLLRKRALRFPLQIHRYHQIVF